MSRLRPSERCGLPISVGDALLAEAELRPDDDTRRAIEEFLGLPRSVEVARVVEEPKQKDPQRDIAKPLTDRRFIPDDPPRPLVARRPAPGETSVQKLPPIAFQAPTWARAEAWAFDPKRGNVSSTPPPLLFAAAKVRAILSATLSTQVDGPELDLPRATREFAEGRRLRALPYRPVPTLRRGAQVLIDVAETLDPIAEDLAQLLAALSDLFGSAHLERSYFARCPYRAGPQPSGVWPEDGERKPWAPPGPGIPVLILSDFTLAPLSRVDDYASLGDWVHFVRHVLAAGCQPVALAAHGPRRWPPALTRLMPFVHWSERTSARDVQRTLRDSKPRRPARR